MRAISTVILFSALTLSLTGCWRGPWNPAFTGSGYAYHNETYKSAPGPESKELGYPYSLAKNEEILNNWRAAIRDLVDQLEQQSGMTPQAVYVITPPGKNAFNNTYDEVLRDELKQRGYTLARVSGDAPNLRYDALLPGEEEEMKKTYYNDDPEEMKPNRLPVTGDFELSLTVLDQTVLGLSHDESAAIVSEFSNTYTLPVYGYERRTPKLRLANPVYGGAK